MTLPVSLAFIGGGNMASALANGLLGTQLAAERVHVVEIHDETRAAWQARGVSVSAQPDDRLARADVWVLAVKPQVMHEVIEQVKPYAVHGPLVISIAAGLRLASIADWLGARNPVDEASVGHHGFSRLVRCMPNTPALVGAGISGLAAPADLPASDRELASSLMQAVGEVVWVDDEAQLDAVTALSGSGPAYVFLFLQALIDGGVKLGLQPGQAKQLALATLRGATQLAADSADPPEVLRQRVTSKGGTTAAALSVLADREWAEAVIQAMTAAAERAKVLGDELA